MNGAKYLEAEIVALRAKVAQLALTDSTPLSAGARRKLDGDLRQLLGELDKALRRLDPVAMPSAIFDPSSPKIVGRFTALALVAQARRPLADTGKFYGSGVYAIYYRGAFPAYAPISGTETPIYVGQAAPALQGAIGPRDQGLRLSNRLNEHRRSISKAVTTLDVLDFDARYLVVQSGWESAAEDYLIHLFQPIWNNEIDILYGIGKHGDAAETRANKRSPWDTLHPGRPWAAETEKDARSIDEILQDLGDHFCRATPFPDTTTLLESFFEELRLG